MSYNTPNYAEQGGSRWVVGGTLTVTGQLSVGGTAGRWAFGSAALTSGTAMIYTGLGQLLSAHVTPIGSGTGAGTATSFQFDWSRAAQGSIFAFGLSGTTAFTGAGTVLWTAFGS